MSDTKQSIEAHIIALLTDSGMGMDRGMATKIVSNYGQEQFEAGWRAGTEAAADVIERRKPAISAILNLDVESEIRILLPPAAPPAEGRKR